MERSTIVKFGKASISMGHLYRFHGYVSHTQRVNIYPNIIKHELNIPHHPHGEVIPRLQGGAHRPVRSTLPGSMGPFFGQRISQKWQGFHGKMRFKTCGVYGKGPILVNLVKNKLCSFQQILGRYQRKMVVQCQPKATVVVDSATLSHARHVD